MEHMRSLKGTRGAFDLTGTALTEQAHYTMGATSTFQDQKPSWTWAHYTLKKIKLTGEEVRAGLLQFDCLLIQFA